MIFENIINKVNNMNGDRFSKIKEVYNEEIKLKNRPAYYEIQLVKSIIMSFDNEIINNIDDKFSTFMLLKNNSKTEKYKEEFKNTKIITVDDILFKYYNNEVSEYIKLKDYKTSIFRILYRHIFNDSENFHPKKNSISEGYITFSLKPVTNELSNFRFRYAYDCYLNDKVETKYKASIKESRDKEVYEYLESAIKTHGYNNFYSKKTRLEILLYTSFLKELDYYILSACDYSKANKITIIKNKEEESKIKDKTLSINIEDFLKDITKNTLILEELEIDKYVYPCWLLASDHFNSQRVNYNVIKDNSNFIELKIFI